MNDDDLNRLVAEKVMGWVSVHAPCDDGLTRTETFSAPTMTQAEQMLWDAYQRHIDKGIRLWPAIYNGPDYATSIADAWEVVEKMNADDLDGSLLFDLQFDGMTYICRFYPDQHSESDTSAPRAICLAALRAKGGGEAGDE